MPYKYGRKIIAYNGKRLVAKVKGLFYERATASGANTVTVTDVSPYKHDAKITLASKNLFNNETKALNYDLKVADTGVTGGLEANGLCFVSDFIPIKPNTTITINYCKNWAFYNADKVFVSGSESKSSAIKRTINVPNDAYYIRFSCVIDKNDGSGVQVEHGATETEYTPYIDDFSGLPLSVYGKNRIDIKTAFLDSYNGQFLKNLKTDNDTLYFEKKTDGAVSVSAYLYAYLKAGTYSFSGIGTTDGGGNMAYVIVNPDGSQLGSTYTIGKSYQNFKHNITVKQNGIYEFRMYIGYEAKANSYVSYEKLLLEAGTTKTEYEPFKNATYTPNADGIIEGVTPFSPTTTVEADGATITLEYDKV